ncbi:hypothetical protein KAR91_39530 [Candidatus Pacearchaeota archaeon]|nr:hypothetical protein [Candidatus Pacearchaeota archaeon]
MSILKAMLTKNSWLWFHVLGGGIIAKACLLWITSIPQLAFIITFGIAICWEILEYNISNINQVYGSQKRFFGDAIGDVFGACVMALVVVL